MGWGWLWLRWVPRTLQGDAVCAELSVMLGGNVLRNNRGKQALGVGNEDNQCV